MKPVRVLASVFSLALFIGCPVVAPVLFVEKLSEYPSVIPIVFKVPKSMACDILLAADNEEKLKGVSGTIKLTDKSGHILHTQRFESGESSPSNWLAKHQLASLVLTRSKGRRLADLASIEPGTELHLFIELKGTIEGSFSIWLAWLGQ
jgi:hypothetical protein